jgi:hypothetical protein
MIARHRKCRKQIELQRQRPKMGSNRKDNAPNKWNGKDIAANGSNRKDIAPNGSNHKDNAPNEWNGKAIAANGSNAKTSPQMNGTAKTLP